MIVSQDEYDMDFCRAIAHELLQCVSIYIYKYTCPSSSCIDGCCDMEYDPICHSLGS